MPQVSRNPTPPPLASQVNGKTTSGSSSVKSNGGPRDSLHVALQGLPGSSPRDEERRKQQRPPSPYAASMLSGSVMRQIKDTNRRQGEDGIPAGVKKNWLSNNNTSRGGQGGLPPLGSSGGGTTVPPQSYGTSTTNAPGKTTQSSKNASLTPEQLVAKIAAHRAKLEAETEARRTRTEAEGVEALDASDSSDDERRAEEFLAKHQQQRQQRSTASPLRMQQTSSATTTAGSATTKRPTSLNPTASTGGGDFFIKTSANQHAAVDSSSTTTKKAMIAVVATPTSSSSAASASGGVVVPRQPKALAGVCYTLSWMGSSGSVFECLAKTLLRRPEWQAVQVDTTRHSETIAAKDPFAAIKKKKQQQQKTGGKTAQKPSATNYVPCCDRLEPLNLFLGDKITSEEFLYDSRLTALRARRMSRAMDPLAPSGVTQCLHRRVKSDAPVSTDRHRKLINYFEGTRDITLKARMVRSLRSHLPGKKLTDILPDTFVLHPRSHGMVDERDDLRARAQNMYKKLVAKEFEGRELALESLWIAKSSHGCHGEGIQLFPGGGDGIEDLIGFIDGQKDVHPWVIQKYVSRPLLVDGRKFDIRYWVLVTAGYKIYVHRRGVMRTSSEPYSSNKVSAHITNHCLQKESSNYSKYEKGNELWHDDLERLCDRRGREMWEEEERDRVRKIKMQQRHGVGGAASSSSSSSLSSASIPPPKTFANFVMPQLEYIVIESLRAVKSKVEDPHTYGSPVECFQLFGFDFICDENMRVQLLEVNGAPGVAEKLNQIIVDDLIELVIEPKFPTHLGEKRQQRAASASNNSPTKNQGDEDNFASPSKSVGANSSAPSSPREHHSTSTVVTSGHPPPAAGSGSAAVKRTNSQPPPPSLSTAHLKQHTSPPKRVNEFCQVYPPLPKAAMSSLTQGGSASKGGGALHPSLADHIKSVLLCGDANTNNVGTPSGGSSVTGDGGGGRSNPFISRNNSARGYLQGGRR